MKERNGFIGPEDYIEPICPLCMDPPEKTDAVRPVPQQRIIEKMDEYMSRRDYNGAERHLLYWLEEAKAGSDKRGELVIRNELVGHYRKVSNRDKAYENGEAALKLLEELEFEGTLSAGTTYINVATAHNAFGDNETALELFLKAKDIYEQNPGTDPRLLGGLYNNMALVCVSLRRFNEAYALYDKALEEMAKVPNGELEQAITYLNIANAVEDEQGMEIAEKQIFEYVDKAYDLLNMPDTLRDGYYAFVCEKCAPTFSYYGYFLAAEELMKRAEQIYEGS